jgi:hypothetical protein
MSVSVFAMALLPKIYQKLFEGKDFSFIFYFNQVIFIIGAVGHLALALKLHEKIGIPSWLFYLLVG